MVTKKDTNPPVGLDAAQLKKIPKKPGIYFFKDAVGKILYIGKAKDLKARVSNYFQRYTTDWKARALISKSATLAFKTMPTELEAMLTEAEQIQKLKPKFNILLKDGQPFLYFFIKTPKKTKTPADGAAALRQLPELELVRSKKKQGSYLGPFIEKADARKVHQFLLKTFRLSLCKKIIPHGCLKYHLGLCAGSCLPNFDVEAYKARLELARKALSQPNKKFIALLDAQIEAHNKKYEFEISKELHAYRTAFEHVLYALDIARNRLVIQDISQEQKPENQTSQPTIAEQVQAFLKTTKPINTIDCFDISHKQGTNMVGSCIRFLDGKADKNSFRRFHIKTVIGQDDYASLREIVARRYKSKADLPDLVLIDGGKGQLNAVSDLFPHLEFASLAKREERLFSKRFMRGKLLDIHNPVGKLLIEMRDYAHHFAITFHRKLSTIRGNE